MDEQQEPEGGNLNPDQDRVVERDRMLFVLSGLAVALGGVGIVAGGSGAFAGAFVIAFALYVGGSTLRPTVRLVPPRPWLFGDGSRGEGRPLEERPTSTRRAIRTGATTAAAGAEGGVQHPLLGAEGGFGAEGP